jgi:hypothetical protein
MDLFFYYTLCTVWKSLPITNEWTTHVPVYIIWLGSNLWINFTWNYWRRHSYKINTVDVQHDDDNWIIVVKLHKFCLALSHHDDYWIVFVKLHKFCFAFFINHKVKIVYPMLHVYCVYFIWVPSSVISGKIYS